MGHICRICGNDNEGDEILLKNVRRDLNEKFSYFRCENCGCIQICEIPDNLGDYYDSNIYYSFDNKASFISIILSMKIIKILRKVAFGTNFYKKRHMDFFEDNIDKINLMLGNDKKSKKRISVVDVGCGTGYFLDQLSALGFKNIMGIDPFLPQNQESQNYVELKKLSIKELDGKWDQIWMMHSLEHLVNPLDDLIAMRERLKDCGKGIIIIPICDSYDFEYYKDNWAGADAPVHIFLHTRKSIKLLLEQAGLRLVSEYHLETGWPLIQSEKLKNGYALDDHCKSLVEILGENKIDELRKKQQDINAKKESGVVTFVVEKAK